MNLLRDQPGVPQTGRGQRIPSLQPGETLPRDAGLVRAATEPLVPNTPHVVPKAAQTPRVPGDPVVREVPTQLRRQGEPLLPDRQLAVLAAPPRRRPQGPAKAVPGRLTLHRPAPRARPTPVVGEPQEVERAGTLTPVGPRMGVRPGSLERDQPGLLRVEGQA